MYSNYTRDKYQNDENEPNNNNLFIVLILIVFLYIIFQTLIRPQL